MTRSLLALAAFLAAAAARADEVDRLLRDLESPEYEVRQLSMEALLEVGLEGKERLLAARNHADPEVAKRVAHVLEHGFLGALLAPRPAELLDRWWDTRAEEIAAALGDRVAALVPRCEVREAREVRDADRFDVLGDWRTVLYPPGRVVGEEEPELEFGGSILVIRRDGSHAWRLAVLEPGSASLLARCDGTGKPGADREAIQALLVLSRFGMVEWLEAALAESRAVPGLGEDAPGPARVRYVLDCCVGE